MALVREKALAKMLTEDIERQEAKWLNYENEEAQVKLDLADLILKELVSDLVGTVSKI